MLELHLHGEALPGRRSDLVAFLREAIPFYERPGGISVRVLWDLVHQDRFIEIIEYVDRETYDRDQARVESDAQMQSYLRRWRELLAREPRVCTYRVDTPQPEM